MKLNKYVITNSRIFRIKKFREEDLGASWTVYCFYDQNWRVTDHFLRMDGGRFEGLTGVSLGLDQKYSYGRLVVYQRKLAKKLPGFWITKMEKPRHRDLMISTLGYGFGDKKIDAFKYAEGPTEAGIDVFYGSDEFEQGFGLKWEFGRSIKFFLQICPTKATCSCSNCEGGCVDTAAL